MKEKWEEDERKREQDETQNRNRIDKYVPCL